MFNFKLSVITQAKFGYAVKLSLSLFRHDLSEDDYVELSKQIQDRIIGTKDGVASVSSYLIAYGVSLQMIVRTTCLS